MQEVRIGQFELECGCHIEAAYLPLNGGERMVTCEHKTEWVIQARRQEVTLFTAHKRHEDKGADVVGIDS